MNTQSISSFLDELEKIALAAEKAPTTPKTAAPPPPPVAKQAPTAVPKPPNMGQMRTATSVANRGAIRPGGDLSAQVDRGAKTMLGAQMGAARQPVQKPFQSLSSKPIKQPAPPRAVTRYRSPGAGVQPMHSMIAPVRSSVSPVRRQPYNALGRNQSRKNVLGF